MLLVYLLLVTSGAVYLQQKITLSNWSESYHLAIGNEVTGDRRWHGHVSQVRLIDREVSELELDCLLTDREPQARCFTPDNAERARYKINSADAVKDQTGQNPPLVWMEDKDAGNDRRELRSKHELRKELEFREEQDRELRKEHRGEHYGEHSEQAWLKSAEPLTMLNRRIAGSGKFTLFVEASTASLHQSGPARVVTISESPYRRNLTLGQQHDNLIVRLRTSVYDNPNGVKPEIIVKGAWLADKVQRILMVVDGTRITIYVDNPGNVFDLSLGPEVYFFSLVAPFILNNACLDSTELWLAKGLFWFVLAVPVMLLMVALFAGNRINYQ